jgi:hypothetical protein
MWHTLEFAVFIPRGLNQKFQKSQDEFLLKIIRHKTSTKSVDKCVDSALRGNFFDVKALRWESILRYNGS